MAHHNRLSRVAWGCILFASVGLFGTGCDDNAYQGLDDTGSYDARMEQARQLIDERQYDQAVPVLRGLRDEQPANTQVTCLLANALTGSAGLDSIRVLEVIDYLDTAGRQGCLDVVGLVLGDATASLTRDDVNAKQGKLDEAIALLEQIPQPDNDIKIQIGVYALHRTGLIMARIIMDDRGRDVITVTPGAIRSLYPGDAVPNPESAHADQLATISADVGRIRASVDTILQITGDALKNNNLARNLNAFAGRLDASGNGSVSARELGQYVGSL